MKKAFFLSLTLQGAVLAQSSTPSIPSALDAANEPFAEVQDPRSVVYAAVGRLNPEPEKKRVALLIGNATYAGNELVTPVHDVEKLGVTLERLGFTVTVRTNLDRDQFRSALTGFLGSIDQDTVSFLYYSGVAMGSYGREYLIPINAGEVANTSADLAQRAIDIQQVYAALPAQAKGSDNFLVLDTSALGPFPDTERMSVGTSERNPCDVNLTVAYAASPGQRAFDAMNYGDQNGPYAPALAKNLSKPGSDWFTAFNQTALQVHQVTAGYQSPTVISRGCRFSSFQFNPR